MGQGYSESWGDFWLKDSQEPPDCVPGIDTRQLNPKEGHLNHDTHM